jgi:hypothetical protein
MSNRSNVFTLIHTNRGRDSAEIPIKRFSRNQVFVAAIDCEIFYPVVVPV